MAPLVAAAVLIGPAPGIAPALACAGWAVLKPPSPGTDPFLSGVAATSSTSAWVAGEYVNKQFGESTLLAHWDGTAWTRTPSPNPAPPTQFNGLSGVAATSASNAWAVGGYASGAVFPNRTLIAHWNGTAWKQVPSPAGDLFGVAATSATSAWAVGHGTRGGSLILHWNGTAWKQVPSPAGTGLAAVTAISPADAWAVGCTGPSGCGVNGAPGERTLILHWNGTAWKQVPSPNPAGGSDNNRLLGVAATSSTSAWAVGVYTQGAGTQTLIAHWNGTSWKRVPSPNPDSFYSVLSGVAATSSTNAWAVGAAGHSSLIAHWNGATWKRVPSPNPGPSFNQLYGVAAPSSTNIWAAGAYQDSTGFQHTLALHRC